MPEVTEQLALTFNGSADDGAQLACPQVHQLAVQNADLRLDAQWALVFQEDAVFNTGGPSPAERLRVLANGNVGIGTATPQARLEVAGDLSVRGDLSLDQGAAGEVSVSQLARDLADARPRLAKIEANLAALIAPDGTLRPPGTIQIPAARQGPHSYVVPLWLVVPDNEFYSNERWRFTGAALNASPAKETVSNLHLQLPRGAVITGYSYLLLLDNDEDSQPVPDVDYPLVIEIQECNFPGPGSGITRTQSMIPHPTLPFRGGGSAGVGAGLIGPAWVTSDDNAYRVHLAAGKVPISPKFSLYLMRLVLTYSVPNVY